MHQLTHHAIERPRVTLMATIALLCWGAVSLLRIPVEQNPKVRIPLIIVAVPYPGAAPDEVEDEVTRAIEDEVRGLRGIRKVDSVSRDSVGVVLVEFDDAIVVADARRDVQQAVDRARADLPDGVEVPEVVDVDIDDFPILQISLYGPLPLPRLKQLAEQWAEPIEALPGVSTVETFGGLEREVLVEGDPARLEHYGLTLGDLAAAVAASHRNLPGGTIDMPTRELRVRTLGQFRRPEQFAQAALRSGDETVRVGDVASVEPEGHARVTSISRVNGHPAVTLLVKKQTDINTLDTLDRIKTLVSELSTSLPPGVDVALSGDQGREIGYMVRQLSESALFGSLVVMLLLLWAIGARNALIVGLAIPGSLLIGFVFIRMAGLVLSGVAMFSLILILGMVVDGAVIVGENIYRHVELGKPPKLAAHDGMREIGVSIFTADLTTVSAFLPLLFVTGVTGQFMSVMPKVVAFALCGSMIMDHYILPVAAAAFMRHKRGQEEGPGLVLGGVLAAYAGALRAALFLPYMVLGVTLLLFATAGGVLASGALGAEFFPKIDTGKFTIDLELPPGTSIERTDRAVARMERALRALPPEEVDAVVTTIGETGALNADLREGGKSGPEYAKIRVELVRHQERERTQAAIVAETRERLDGLVPGGRLTVTERREGPPVGSAIALRLQDDDLDRLDAAARGIERLMRASAHVRDVRNDFVRGKPELRVTVDHQLAALSGVTPAGVAQAVATAYRGDTRTEMTIGDEKVDVRVRMAGQRRLDLTEVEALPIRAGSGTVPLGQVARISLGRGLSEINRRDGRRTATLRCEPAEGVDTKDARERLRTLIEAEVAAGALPEVRIEYGGETEEEDEALASLQGSMGLAVLLVLSILVFQFNSYRQAFIILGTVPLALIGVIFGMFLLGYKLGFLPFVGVVSLTGIVVNDAIVLVDFANQARRRGLATEDALIEAGKARFRPVLLTTVTTIGGLMPLALNLTGGGAFWAPLCWAIICGLIAALALTLLVVPVLYRLVEGPGETKAAPAAATRAMKRTIGR